MPWRAATWQSARVQPWMPSTSAASATVTSVRRTSSWLATRRYAGVHHLLSCQVCVSRPYRQDLGNARRAMVCFVTCPAQVTGPAQSRGRVACPPASCLSRPPSSRNSVLCREHGDEIRSGVLCLCVSIVQRCCGRKLSDKCALLRFLTLELREFAAQGDARVCIIDFERAEERSPRGMQWDLAAMEAMLTEV